MKTYTDEHRQGHRAHIAGKFLHDSPYSGVTHAKRRQRRLWESGWLEQYEAALMALRTEQGLT